MMHEQRRWTVSIVESAEVLAESLSEFTWTTCSGFSVAGREDVLFLNDATGPDGAQEYAVVRREGDDYWQVESVAFSWCTREEALAHVRAALGQAPAPATPGGPVVVATSAAILSSALGSEPGFRRRVSPRIESAEEHRASACCA